MEISEHIAAVGREAQLFAAAARRAGLDTDVETCPGWSVRDLVRHLSEIHLWAAGIVAGCRSEIWPEGLSTHVETWPNLAVFWPEDGDLIDWYLETNANLMRCLEAASPNDDIPAFLPAPSPLAMWAARHMRLPYIASTPRSRREGHPRSLRSSTRYSQSTGSTRRSTRSCPSSRRSHHRTIGPSPSTRKTRGTTGTSRSVLTERSVTMRPLK
ncbi:MAG: maleylpyruvate isomerase family protein [Actinobacteria bacterium]|nr:maleylpyruvate isomerase family protein [Actinomycetota bacterium]